MMTDARHLRSYGRRKGHALSARKERLVQELLPRLRLPLAGPSPRPLTLLFLPGAREVWLEIGFGSGEHLLWQAEHKPEVGFIGCEPFINGVASLLGGIEDRGLGSIRIHDGDAREVLGWLPDGSTARVFLLFPDPWPKSRHLKRRLLTPEIAAEFARVLKPTGEMRFASDSGDYAGQALAILLGSGAFAWDAECAADWQRRPVDWPQTRYERKALSEGRKPVYLRLRRL
jgi:tRNA (guanine-N7-)-methyltransferase